MEPQDGKLKARLEKLPKQISDLSERMAAFWQDMEAENISFLQVQSKHSMWCQGPKVQQRALICSKHVW